MKNLSLALALSVIGTFAQAATTSASAPICSFEDFRDSCQNPGAHGAQRPPEAIKIQCKNVRTGWQQIESGATGLAESRVVTAELFSDKFEVAAVDYNINTPEANVVCPRLREVVQTVAIEKSLTCGQILATEDGMDKICLDAINEAISANPDLVQTTPTGRLYSVCGSVVQKP